MWRWDRWDRSRLIFWLAGVLVLISRALDVEMGTVQVDFMVSWCFGVDISRIRCGDGNGEGGACLVAH